MSPALAEPATSETSAVVAVMRKSRLFLSKTGHDTAMATLRAVAAANPLNPHPYAPMPAMVAAMSGGKARTPYR